MSTLPRQVERFLDVFNSAARRSQRRITTFWPIKLGGTPVFQTDGCSGWITWGYRTFLHRDPPWEGCCEVHDWRYWRGGTRADRRWADQQLREGVQAKSGWLMGLIFYVPVRLFGGPYSILSWRWNYREPFWRSRYR